LAIIEKVNPLVLRMKPSRAEAWRIHDRLIVESSAE
jgi:hypothetical protein